MMKRLGYYPGCSMPGTAREYDESVRALAARIGVELVEVPDWNCCGATAAHNLNRDLSLSLPARILALAEREGLDEILVPCAACYNRLTMTRTELASDEGLRSRISDIIGLPLAGTSRVLNIVEALASMSDDIQSARAGEIAQPVACYYGCLLVRPPKALGFDRAEDPRSMDDIVASLGGTPVAWPFKTECCGAGFSVSRTDIVADLSSKIVKDAVRRGAEMIVVACPMCHANLDMRRKDINRAAGEKLSIPVLYITQYVGLALGIDRRSLGLQRHVVSVPKFNLNPITLQGGPSPAPAVTAEE